MHKQAGVCGHLCACGQSMLHCCVVAGMRCCLAARRRTHTALTVVMNCWEVVMFQEFRPKDGASVEGIDAHMRGLYGRCGPLL
jgi:hypothetical protein